MQDNVIKNIKFTQAEMKILSCFAQYITKSKLIGIILGCSPKTIDTHTDNIKRKINTNNKEDICFFVKGSNKLNDLKNIFDQQYASYKYKQAAKKIEYKLKTLSAICHFYVSDELKKKTEINEISQLIEIAGIRKNNIDTLVLHTISSNAEPNQFYLFVVQNIDEIKYLQKYIENCDQNIIYVCFNKPSKEIKLFKNDIFFYHKEDKKYFYRFFLNFLMKTYKITDEKNEILETLSSIDNNIHSKIEENEQSFSRNKKNGTMTARVWIIISALLILSVLYIGKYHYSPTEKNQPINTGASNLNKNPISGVLIYNLPQINRHFIGRLKDLVKIKNNFLKENIGIKTQVIVGSGGIGKTQLATEYAYKSIKNKEYDAVLWISADSLNKINDTYVDLANRLEINIKNLNLTAIKKNVHNKLLEKYKIKKILFVLDHVSQKKEIEPFLTDLQNQWPIDLKTHVLISSKNQHFDFPLLMLDVFTKEEALYFIKKHLPYENELDIFKLIELLHYYPLALEQAVGYIKQHTNIKDYFLLYKSNTPQYLNLFADNFDENQETLWKTLLISLSKLDENAKKVLYISSYFEANNIQFSCFNQFTVEQKANAIQQLRKHSFIILSKDRQSFKMHLLIQNIIRLMIQDNTIWINKALALAKKGAASFDSTKKLTWGAARNWLPHVSAMYHYAPKTLETAELLDTYGNIAKHFGRYDLTHELFANSLSIKELFYKEDNNIKLIEALNNLGEIELKLAHYNKAKALYYKVLEKQQAYYKDSNDINLSETLNNIGSVEMLKGNYNKSKEFYQKALKIKEEHYKTSEHIELINTLEGLGHVELYFGHHEKAKTVFTKALKIKESYYQDPNHINLATTLDEIGYIEICHGFYQKAKTRIESVLRIYNKTYQGADNILIAPFLQHLAVAEWGLGNFKTAINLYKRALQIKQDHYQNPRHIAISTALQGLGLAEYSRGNYADAKKFLEKDLRIRKKHYQSAEHIALVSPLHTLGLSEEGLGNYNIALSHINKAYTIGHNFFKTHLQKAMGTNYSETIPWPHLISQNKEQAIEYYKKSLDITKKFFGEESHMVARYHYLLGQAYEINGQKSQAIKQYEKALILARQVALFIHDESVIIQHQKNMNLARKKLAELDI